EAHDLLVGATLGVEVRAALAATDGHAGQCVLEDLLEAEELDDRQVDAGVEPQAALVGAEGGVELDAEAAVDLDLTVVGDPRHAEDDLALGLADALENGPLAVLGAGALHRAEALHDLVDRLLELAFPGAARHAGVEVGLPARGQRRTAVRHSHGARVRAVGP